MISVAPTTLRDRQRRTTVDTILAAVGICLADPALATLNFTQVAEVAGVGERTIYRHFPTKDALLNAWWAQHKAKIGQPDFPDTPAAVAAFPLRAFPLMDKDNAIMRGAVLSPQGRALTLAHNDKRQAAFLKTVKDAAPDLCAQSQRDLAAIIQLLQSATAWLTLKDYWGLDGEQAGAAASVAITTLLNAAAQESYQKETKT